MDAKTTRRVLEEVAAGTLPVAEALGRLRMEPFQDLGFAKLDHHRALRQGAAEVIYGAGKTAEQMIEIVAAFRNHGQETVLITRLSPESAEKIAAVHPLNYHEMGRVGIVGPLPEPDGDGIVTVATGGTSDMAVAEEAALTAEALGSQVLRLYDVGVAGIHRLLAHAPELMRSRAVVAVAGMEGALTSVIGGLVDCPVIGVPTSVGYGAAFGGVAALLAMLNSCASGVSVVNIDNGFGAGFLANRINHMGGKM